MRVQKGAFPIASDLSVCACVHLLIRRFKSAASAGLFEFPKWSSKHHFHHHRRRRRRRRRHHHRHLPLRRARQVPSEKSCSKTSRRHHQQHLPFQLLLKVFVVARVFFKRWNPSAAEDGGVKRFIVVRVIFKRRNPGPKKYAAARGDPDASPIPDRAGTHAPHMRAAPSGCPCHCHRRRHHHLLLQISIPVACPSCSPPPRHHRIFRNTHAPHFTPQHRLLCHMGVY